MSSRPHFTNVTISQYKSLMDNLPHDCTRDLLGILFLLTSVSSIFLNSCMLTIMYKNKALRTPSNTILTALSYVDFLTGLFVAPMYAIQLFNITAMNTYALNEARRVVAAIFALSSANIVCFISLDRCLHLVYLSNYSIQKKTVYTGIFFCWLIPALTPLLRQLKDGEVVYSYCVNGQLIGSLFFILVFYLIVLVILHRYTKHHSSLVHSYIENQRRATRTVILIILFYVVMNIPIVLHFAFYIFNKFSSSSRSFQFNTYFLAKSYVIGSYLCASNSFVNPLVYCLQTPTLRKHFLQLISLIQKESRRRMTFSLQPMNSLVSHLK